MKNYDEKNCMYCKERKPIWDFHRKLKTNIISNVCKECEKKRRPQTLNQRISQKLGDALQKKFISKLD